MKFHGALFGLFAVAPAFALSGLVEPTGSSGYKLLKLPSAPREVGLSMAGVAVSSPLGGQNPAIDTLDRAWVGVGLARGYAHVGGDIQQMAWASPFFGATLAGRLRFQSWDGLKGYGERDNATGEFTASTWGGDLNWSSRLDQWVPGLVVGLGAGGGMNHVSDVQTFAGWLNAGATWNDPTKPWSVGFSARNAGLSTRGLKSRETLPLTLQAGGAWKWELPGTWALTGFADVRHVVDENLTMPLGLEATYGSLRLRTGYQVGRAEGLPSLGAAIVGKSWSLDVATLWHAGLGFAPAATVALAL